MKLLSKTAFAIYLAFGNSITTFATVINFDSLAGGPIQAGEQVTTQYSGLGVTFVDSYSGGAHANNTLTSLISGSSSPNVLWVDQSSGGSSGQYLEIDFSHAIDSFSTLFGTSLGANITLNAYHGATLLGTQTLVGATIIGDVRSGQIDFNSSSGITSVQLFSNPVGTTTSFNFSVDNVTISSVPIPAAVWLLGSGLLGLIGVAQRKEA